MARIRAVLFDIDGTLLDSNDAWSHAWLDALRGHGLLVPLDRVRACLGMHPDEVIAELTDIAPRSAEARAIADRRSAILREHYASDVGPLPGARALVDRLRSRGLVCGAVSGARRAEVEGLLRAAIVDDLMEVVVCDEDLREAPERGEAPSVGLVRIALARAGTSPTETAFVGDTPHDVETGRRAGVAVVALRSGGFRDLDLEGAIAIYEGPSELASRLDQSPLGRGVDEETLPPRPRRPAMRGGA